jgi:methylated-DNA-[protein]-cysteine S-methyltransferase
MNYYAFTDSPIGPLLVHSDGTSLTGLYMNTPGRPTIGEDWIQTERVEPIRTTLKQLREYFSGSRRDFDLPLRTQGTAFQRRVWRALGKIPYGETWSYGKLAQRIDNPKASRAVGLANGANPISIVVPCHRVIGANGTLTGYGGGLNRKRWLLTHEGCAFKG